MWSNWCILNLLLVCLSLHKSVSLPPPQPADNFLCALSKQREASKLVCEKCLVPESVFVVLLYHSNYNQFIHIIGSGDSITQLGSLDFSQRCIAWHIQPRQQEPAWLPGNCSSVSAKQVKPSMTTQLSLSNLPEKDFGDKGEIAPG